MDGVFWINKLQKLRANKRTRSRQGVLIDPWSDASDFAPNVTRMTGIINSNISGQCRTEVNICGTAPTFKSTLIILS